MTLCIHDLEPDLCGTCTDAAPTGRAGGGTSTAGRSFALILAPALRADTDVHLNREGDTWAIRSYDSPGAPAVELGRSSRGDLDLASIRITDTIGYPYSQTPGGVSVRDTRYWWGEIQKANTRLDPVRPPA